MDALEPMSMSSERPEPHRVVELPRAGVPADHGLASLGLLMQLAGSALAAGAALLALLVLLWLRQLPYDGARGELGWALTILGLSFARSLFHRRAGSELLYASRARFGATASPLAGVRLYIHAGLGHAVLVAMIVHGELGLPGGTALACAAGLALWPIALSVATSRAPIARFAGGVPYAEDKGFEGAAILMTVLGASGALGAGVLVAAGVMITAHASSELFGSSQVLIVFGLAALLVRSIVHVRTGLAGLRETSLDRSVELASRYTSFGVISAFLACGAMLLSALEQRIDVWRLVLVGLVCWLLLAWPLIVRRFFSDRQFADLFAGDDAAVHRRAPDAGLTGLGWLLVGHAVFSASFLLPQLGGVAGLAGPLAPVLALGGGAGAHSLWWNLAIAGLELWAGYELVRMSPRRRAVAWIYGGAAALATASLAWPALDHALASRDGELVMALAPAGVQLVMAVATILLVTRRIAPAARARFRRAPEKAVRSARGPAR